MKKKLCSKKRIQLLNPKGMTLIEVMIVAGILAGLAIVIMKIGSLQISTSKKAFQSQSIYQVVNEINIVVPLYS